MYLTYLSLTNFRNFARLDVEVPRGPILLVGANAQGKTSLLEAVYFLATFVSFHASNERQLINIMATQEPLAVGRISANFTRFDGLAGSQQPKTHRLEVRLILEASINNGGSRLRKEVLLDGTRRKMSEVISVFNAVLFLPQMLTIVEGAPDDRRRYLNLAMAQAVPNFAATLSDYNQILTQRNALLKQLGERRAGATTAASQLVYWDEQLARTGAEIMYARIHVIRDLEHYANQFHRELTHGQEVLHISYQPSFEPLPVRSGQYSMRLDTHVDRTGLTLDKIRTSFGEGLNRVRALDIDRGISTIGPHRDEMRFQANQMDLGVYGSRGQARTAVLALKLAEVAWMKQRTGDWPVLLLDEVLAELDPIRRLDLLDRLSETEQALMTTTDLELFSSKFIQTARIWQINAGQITRVGEPTID
jgi:DNA replication and repair protein RecF